MTLDQLRIFVAVAERQHVTHAAEALNLAQSAASHAIANLEERHQTKLFNRIGRHIELTDAGQTFLKEARAVLAAAEAAELVLIEFSKPETRGAFSSGEPNYCELLVAPAFSGVSERLSADRDKSEYRQHGPSSNGRRE